MAGRILVIRGGAIGDFILTLPAIGLIRQNLPDVRIEILGYPSVTPLALSPNYADAVHSIEYAPLAGFFSRKPNLDSDMSAFFSGFQQVISYLYDPDAIFENNLRAAGVKNLLTGPGKLGDDIHAVHQLARPLENLAFFLEDTSAKYEELESDRLAVDAVLQNLPSPFVAIHPGSGGKKKIWPVENWRQVIKLLLAEGKSVVLVGGEADRENLASLEADFRIPVIENLPLRTLGALLSRSELFLGHDSGISHLAAATGVPCLLLFGPTDPEIWAPLNPNVRVVLSTDGTMDGITPESVGTELKKVFSRVG